MTQRPQTSAPPEPSRSATSAAPGRRRRRYLFTAAALLLVALLGYGVFLHFRPVREPVRVLFGPKPAPLWGDAPAAPPVDLAAAPPAQARRKAGPGEVELCGVGVFSEADLLAGRAQPDGLPDVRRTGEALIRELAARAEPRARATALVLQATAPAWNGSREQVYAQASGDCALPDFPGAPVSAPTGDSPRDATCRAEWAQRQQVWQAQTFAATQPLAQLVQLAQQSADPALFALAYDLCGSPDYRQVPACQVDLLGLWARLEPANAQPWLLMASRAQNAKDANAQYQALYQASRAKYQRGYAGATADWLLRDVPAGQRNAADLVRDHLATRLMLLQAGPGLAAGMAVGQACKPADLQDGNLRQLCQSLADTLSRNTDSPMGALIAARVGQRAGWSEDRFQAVVQPVRDTLDAAVAVQLRIGSADDVAGLSCEAVSARAGYLRNLGSRGELQAMREAMAASGKSLAELKAEHRALTAKLEARAQLAASAALGLMPR